MRYHIQRSTVVRKWLKSPPVSMVAADLAPHQKEGNICGGSRRRELREDNRRLLPRNMASLYWLAKAASFDTDIRRAQVLGNVQTSSLTVSILAFGLYISTILFPRAVYSLYHLIAAMTRPGSTARDTSGTAPPPPSRPAGGNKPPGYDSFNCPNRWKYNCTEMVKSASTPCGTCNVSHFFL